MAARPAGMLIRQPFPAIVVGRRTGRAGRLAGRLIGRHLVAGRRGQVRLARFIVLRAAGESRQHHKHRRKPHDRRPLQEACLRACPRRGKCATAPRIFVEQ